jgi:hypothetical protein
MNNKSNINIYRRVTSVGVLCIALFGSVVFSGCTAQERARSFGGTAEVKLPAGRKLITVTFKETDIWYLTRAAKPDEKPETYEFTESASWGILEGKVIIREQ